MSRASMLFLVVLRHSGTLFVYNGSTKLVVLTDDGSRLASHFGLDWVAKFCTLDIHIDPPDPRAM
jgi:hypothetical protein